MTRARAPARTRLLRPSTNVRMCILCRGKKKIKTGSACTCKSVRASCPPETHMDAFEVRLCEEVRRYRHLYDSSCKDYKNVQVTHSAWKEIALTRGKDEAKCRNKWKYLRDRFVKTKRIKGRGGATGSGSAMIPIYSALGWLSAFVKHRATPSNLTALENPPAHHPKSDVSSASECPAAAPSPSTSAVYDRTGQTLLTVNLSPIQTRLERLDRIGEQREDAGEEAQLCSDGGRHAQEMSTSAEVSGKI
ncbi:uncharacterized protein LOC127529830 [Erpetoichthys calabaricus]|uniref:uncharacterized protein LOC127529830 n=1 Tax=Erpetoichthys calabaricus TaxID=27687 RepID=UPI002234D0BA|nr:uncharacterized protein LOC127529830 [Erpetoichthys calabaricus]